MQLVTRDLNFSSDPWRHFDVGDVEVPGVQRNAADLAGVGITDVSMDIARMV
jgi:hypothetical protein